MAKAQVTIIDLKLGRLPGRCLITGAPTENLVRRRLHVVPPWTWWLLVGGLLPAAIVQAVVGDDVRARLLIGPPVMAARRRKLRLAGGPLGGAVVVAVLASALETSGLLIGVLGLLGASAGLAVAAKADLPSASYGLWHQTVWLTRIHPDAPPRSTGGWPTGQHHRPTTPRWVRVSIGPAMMSSSDGRGVGRRWPARPSDPDSPATAPRRTSDTSACAPEPSARFSLPAAFSWPDASRQPASPTTRRPGDDGPPAAADDQLTADTVGLRRSTYPANGPSCRRPTTPHRSCQSPTPACSRRPSPPIPRCRSRVHR
jgi:hypothetical protein